MDPFDPRDTPNRERDQRIALAAADLSQDWTLTQLDAPFHSAPTSGMLIQPAPLEGSAKGAIK